MKNTRERNICHDRVREKGIYKHGRVGGISMEWYCDM